MNEQEGKEGKEGKEEGVSSRQARAEHSGESQAMESVQKPPLWKELCDIVAAQSMGIGQQG
eukprot:1140771-Pelagomonas_calceolata.AAC.5